MNSYHTRVIVLHYCDEDLQHIDKMEAAIGRAVCYDLASGTYCDTEQLTQIFVRKDEFNTCYYKRLAQYSTLDISKLMTPNPFVVGAVPYNGTYSFHS